MNNFFKIIAVILLCSVAIIAQTDWTHRVRIAGNPLSSGDADSIVKSAVESSVYGIEVDNDITGRYESFLNPSEKLNEIKRAVYAAQKANNKTFVYIAGLECITPEADSKEHTFFKDHPDWVQRDITGKPAIFGGKDAFWIKEGDEDVWITPYAAEWRKVYMQRVREIAATGIDGIYVDIPYWMTHFTGWENTWASFDDYTVQAFKENSGLDAKKDIKLGDYSDPGFIKWINFRMQTLTEFMKEIDKNIKEVNPQCKTIAEIYPGLGEEAVRVGADVFQMYNVVDVIAHEYSEGEYYASDRAAADWYNYINGMRTFRAFADEKASWMLSYSWVDNKNVKAEDAMKSLFVSQLFAGTNMWDVKGFVMSSTNDMNTRKEVFSWVSQNEDIFYSGSKPFEPVGVYFSDLTRNYFSEDFISSYRGILNLLTHLHLPYQIVTSRTIDKLKPGLLIMPDVKAVSSYETAALQRLMQNGAKIVFTGDFGKYDGQKKMISGNGLEIKNTDNVLYFSECPGKKYTALISRDLNNYFNNNTGLNELNAFKDKFVSDLKKFSSLQPKIQIEAPIDLISRTDITDENIFIYLTNVRALCEACNMKKNLEDIKIMCDNSLGIKEVYALPFLGSKTKLPTENDNGIVSFSVPEIKKGTIIIIKRK